MNASVSTDIRSPWRRALWILPLTVVALFAAPIAFNVRTDAPDLGWLGVWGLSIAQAVMGLSRRLATDFLGGSFDSVFDQALDYGAANQLFATGEQVR